MTPKRLTNFRIDDELLEGLEAIRVRDGVPVSEQVRRAIRMWLQAKGASAKPVQKSKRAKQTPK